MARVTVSDCLSSPSVTSSDLTVGWDVSSWMTRGASVTTSSPTAVAAAAHCRQTTVSIVADHKCLSTFQTNHLSYRTLSLIKDILSSLVTLARPSTSSSLRITDHSFHYASPRLWSQLPASLRQPRTNLSNSDSPSPSSCTSSIGSIDSPLWSSICPSFFHSRLKTFLFCKSFPPSSGLTQRIPRTVYRYFWAYPFFTF